MGSGAIQPMSIHRRKKENTRNEALFLASSVHILFLPVMDAYFPSPQPCLPFTRVSGLAKESDHRHKEIQ